jgi:diguanylate cyclase (GGDEF)-like protein
LGVVTASFGVAAATAGNAETTENLVQAADQALYEAKRQGRNRVERGPTLGKNGGR